MLMNLVQVLGYIFFWCLTSAQEKSIGKSCCPHVFQFEGKGKELLREGHRKAFAVFQDFFSHPN